MDKGRLADTYNLRVHSGPVNVNDVPVRLLRKVLQPRPYEVGEQAEVQVTEGANKGSWIKCNITHRHDSPDGFYGIRVSLGAASGYMDLQNVSVRGLRKVGQKTKTRVEL